MGTRFWRMLSAYLINSIGDQFYAVALPLTLLQLGYSPAAATFLQTVVMATTVAAGFLVGHVVDRHDPGPLLIGTYAGSAVVLVIGALVIGAGADGYPATLAVAAVLGLFAAISAAGADAGVPKMAPASRIHRGYSLMESARAAATVLGPAFAGVAAIVRSLVVVLGVNALSFVLASVVAGFGKVARRQPRRDGRSAWQQLGDGLRVIAHDHRLRLGIGLSLLINITLGADEPLVLTRFVRDFRLSGTVTALLMAVVGVVSILVTLAVSRWSARRSALRVLLGSVLVLGASGAGLGFAPGPTLLTVLFCLNSAAVISYNVNWRSYRQALVGPELLGRISASCRSLAYVGVVIGTAIVGTLQESGRSAAFLLMVGGGLCLLGLFVVAALLRRNIPVAEPA